MTILPMLETSLADARATAPAKERALLAALGSEPAIVAFSGGVDSTYVAWAAHRALGDAALAITAVSPSLAAYSRTEARALARHIGIRHELIDTAETSDPRYLRNGTDRCYWCKDELYGQLEAIASERGLVALFDGTNADDLSDIRPGRRAAQERGVRSPLVEAGLTKNEVRLLSRDAGLPSWHRPASPCLSSRVPHGTPIEVAMLARIDRAEAAVRSLGFREFRVRHHGPLARLEVSAVELARALEPAVSQALKAGIASAGYDLVAVDTEPFRTGRLAREASARDAAR